MICIHCQSPNLEVVESGPHKKLICTDCYAFQQFLSAADYKVFNQLKEKREKKKSECIDA